VDVLLGAGLDERAVGDRAAGVDATAADADPIRRVLGLTCSVLRHGRHRPVARDRVEQGAALLEGPLVVTEPVRALVGVQRTDELPVRRDARTRRRGRGESCHAGGREERRPLPDGLHRTAVPAVSELQTVRVRERYPYLTLRKIVALGMPGRAAAAQQRGVR